MRMISTAVSRAVFGAALFAGAQYRQAFEQESVLGETARVSVAS